MIETQNETPERGLRYERPLGVLRGFLREPETPVDDPYEAEERLAIQQEESNDVTGESEAVRAGRNVFCRNRPSQ